jgi:hypothetical protein
MSAVSTSLIVFGCVFGGALLGLSLRKVLPEPHRSGESKDLVKSGTGLIATISALVLGLLVASAKSAYDTQKNEITEQAAKISLLDRVLAHYGPETKGARDLLRAAVQGELEQLWPDGRSREPQGPVPASERVYDAVQDLSPATDAQRGLKAQAFQLMIQLASTHSLMQAQKGSSVNGAFLVVVVFWLTVNFVSFGLFAPRNATVAITLFVCSLSVGGAIFLILEMDQPFRGLIRIPDTPMRELVERLGR